MRRSFKEKAPSRELQGEGLEEGYKVKAMRRQLQGEGYEEKTTK